MKISCTPRWRANQTNHLDGIRVELDRKLSLALLKEAQLPLSVRDTDGRGYGLADAERATHLLESGRAVGVGNPRRLQSLRLLRVDNKGDFGRGEGSITWVRRRLNFEHARRCHFWRMSAKS